MTFWTLARRSLRFYLRSHLGTILGAAIVTAVLTGALLVGAEMILAGKSLIVNWGPRPSTKALSISLLSSRTFPGHL